MRFNYYPDPYTGWLTSWTLRNWVEDQMIMTENHTT